VLKADDQTYVVTETRVTVYEIDTEVGTSVVYVAITLTNVDLAELQANVVYSTTIEVYYVGT
jgi:hypothetical protein